MARRVSESLGIDFVHRKSLRKHGKTQLHIKPTFCAELTRCFRFACSDSAESLKPNTKLPDASGEIPCKKLDDIMKGEKSAEETTKIANTIDKQKLMRWSCRFRECETSCDRLQKILKHEKSHLNQQFPCYFCSRYFLNSHSRNTHIHGAHRELQRDGETDQQVKSRRCSNMHC